MAATSPRDQNAGALATITEADIPDCLSPGMVPPGDDWPGQYL